MKKFDAGALEQMFRQHLFSLPMFILYWGNIAPRFRTWSDSKSLYSVFGFPVPILYVLLLCTTVFAQINRYMSTNLAIETGPLESQIVCAATKTIVLLVSLLYFNAPPYPSVRIWGGVLVQLFGSLLYARLSNVSNDKEGSRIIRKLGTADPNDSGTESDSTPVPPLRTSSTPLKKSPLRSGV